MKKVKKNSKKFNNKTLIIVSVLLVIVGLFILFKASTWGIYKSLLSDLDGLEDIMTRYRNSEDISIEKIDKKDRLEFEWFSVGNYFDEFKHDSNSSTDWNETYYQYDGEEKVGMLSAGTFTSLVEATKEDITIYGSGDYNGLDFSGMFFTGIDNFVKKNNIKDDADLIKEFTKLDVKKDLGVFSSLRDLREDYSLKLLMSIALPSVDKIYYMYGGYKGYILEINTKNNERTCFEINLFKDGKRYILTILSKDFSIDMIKEVVGTIEIK